MLKFHDSTCSFVFIINNLCGAVDKYFCFQLGAARGSLYLDVCVVSAGGNVGFCLCIHLYVREDRLNLHGGRSLCLCQPASGDVQTHLCDVQRAGGVGRLPVLTHAHLCQCVVRGGTGCTARAAQLISCWWDCWLLGSLSSKWRRIFIYLGLEIIIIKKY